jgi:hypothetical protein
MQQEEAVQGYLVYAGVDRSGNKWVHVYYRLKDSSDNNGQSAEEYLPLYTFDKPIFKKVGIGGVVQCGFKGDTSVSFNKNKWPCDVWKNKEERVKWHAKKAAFDQEDQVIKDVKANDLIETLKPIRQAYRESSTQNRRAILAEVIRIITT